MPYTTPVPPISNIDIRLLRVFKAVVESGGFAAAEAELNIGRSTISTHISDLETRMGMRLCERGRRGFSLSDHGEVVYASTIQLFESLEAFRDQVGGVKGFLMGDLSICLMDSVSSDKRNLISGAIKKFKQRPGNVYLTINVNSPKEVERAVLDNRAQIGIGLSAQPLAGLEYTNLYQEEVYLYCSEDHPLYDVDKIDDEMLGEHQYVSKGYLAASEKAMELPCTDGAKSLHLEGTLQMILSGSYLGYLPNHYAEHWSKIRRLKAIMPERYSSNMYVKLITRKGTGPSANVDAFVDDFQRVMGLKD